ncbi:MAG: hypothetical protein JWP22_1548 [Ramlibacter sp.]|nr:hypothetical protein [Ramlibacter sp.]MDB5912873.1 hypothetical protein [Ramlibacter sp.]
MTVAVRAGSAALMVGSVVGAMGFASSGAASAQTRTIYSVAVPVEVERDSNPAMSVVSPRGTTWLRARPAFTARYVAGAEEYSVDGALSLEKSSDTSVARDRINPRIRGTWRRTDDVGSTEFFALADRRPFRALSIDERVPAGVDGTRTLVSVGGRMIRDVSEVTRMEAGVRQDWERNSASTLPDFQRTLVDARWMREEDERRSWYLAANGDVYRPDGAGSSEVAGLLAGVVQQFSPELRFDINAGPMHFFQGGGRTDWQGTARFEYSGDRLRVALEASRAPSTSIATAGLVVGQEFRVRASYDITRSTNAELTAGHGRDRGMPTGRTIATAAVNHQLSAAWTVSARASHISQQSVEGTARARLLTIALTYSHPDF